MSDDKRDAIDALNELIELTTLDEGDPQSFRVRAYEGARQAIEAHTGELRGLTVAQLSALPGIGKSTAQKLRELFDAGRIEKLEALRAKHPQAIVDLLRIPGLGPKAVNRLRKELGVGGIDDLRRAVEAHALRDLAGFGKKSEEKLAATLERIAREGGERRAPIAVALPMAERITNELRAIPGVVRVEACGSLRRFSETVGDLDIIVAGGDPDVVMERLVSLPMIDRVLGRGAKKTSAVTRRGLQIDLRVVALHELGAALVYFTGSKAHNIQLRQRALARGLTLNEYALSEIETGRVVACEDEESVYAALGLPFIPPVLREGAGEIALAEAGELPRAVDTSALLGDFHVHTDLSGDGRSSLEEVVAAARARGYRVLAITDHAENLPLTGVDRARLVDQGAKVRALQKELGDAMTLLHGAELNIGPRGELDYDDELRRSLDFCLASVHDHFDLDRASQTARILVAMHDPSVHMIGHLSARTIGKRPPIELDIDAILDGAARTGTALEINGGLPRLDASADVVRRARDRDVTFVLTSDAHHTSELDRVVHAGRVAHKAWLAPSKIANTWERERFLKWLSA